jgi:hypothetical protein
MATGGQATAQAVAAQAAAAAKAKATTVSKPTQTARPIAESYTPPKPAQTLRPQAESFTPSPSTRTPTVVAPKPVVSTKPKTSTTSTVPADTGGQAVQTGKTLVSRTPRYDKDSKIIGWDLVYSDGSTGFESNPAYGADEETTVGTTNVQVLKAILTAKGLPSDLVEDSVPFLQTLLKEGIDGESAVSIYLNSKSFTTKAGTVLASPFYNKYGFYNDKLTEKYDAATLFNTIEGYKSVSSKYTLDPKFTSQDYIQKYLSNKRSVAAFDKAANTARLLAVNADPVRVSTLRTLGYINNAQDLTDFYLDANVGTEKMQQNVNTAAFAIEAVRRANTLTPFSKTTAEQYGAALTAQGLDEAAVTALASQGYQRISETLEPLTKTSGIYEGAAAKDAATIQSELEAEQFKGLESERRKRLSEQYARSLQGQSGITTQSLSTGAYLA